MVVIGLCLGLASCKDDYDDEWMKKKLDELNDKVDGLPQPPQPQPDSTLVGFESYGTAMLSPEQRVVALVLPATLKASDITAIRAEVVSTNGTGSDIQTRTSAEPWSVEVTMPAFDANGVIAANHGAKVTLTPPAYLNLSETAVLRVTVMAADGKEWSVSRPVKYFEGTVVTCAAGGLSVAVTDATVKRLAIKGSIDKSDFAYIRESLTALEVLDLSQTDLAVMPQRALALSDVPNRSIREVMLPQTLTEIDTSAFANCRALTRIDIEQTQVLRKWAFSNCTSLQEVVMHRELREIENSAFYGNALLASVDIPAGVRTLGRWIFEGCRNLETVTLHEGLEYLSPSTFYGCGITSIRIPSTVTVIPNWTFQECHNLTNVFLHNGITEIGEAAFLNCAQLRNFTVPTGVTVLQKNLFESCINLNAVNLHNNITEIQERAFYNCRNLELGTQNPNLPTALTTLGVEAFGACSKLGFVSLPDGLTALPDYVFHQCTKLNGVTLNQVQTIGEWAFGGCTSLVGIDLPASVTAIADHAFFDCDKLYQVYSRATTAPTIEANTFDPNYQSIRYLYILRSNPDYNAWRQNFGKGVQAVL